MSTRITRRKKSSPAAADANREGVTTDPYDNLAGFDVGETIREIESAVTDSGPFYQRMETNERARQCWWEGKTGTGRKAGTKKQKARPWEGAADYEVHLAQEVLLQLTAQRAAAIMRGNLCVTPMEGTDVRAATQMRLVLRYYLEGGMRGERLIQGTHWASWTLRYGHNVLYVGWKTVKAMEDKIVKESELIAAVMAQQVRIMQEAQQPIDMVMGETLRINAELKVRELDSENDLAKLLIAIKPELKARGKAAMIEAVRCIRTMRKDVINQDREGHYFAAYVKEDRPMWEALRQGVDFFCPPETMHEETFDSARWLARVRWLSTQQLLEAAAIHDWDAKWVNQVIVKCKGKSHMFTAHTSGTPWALSGLGVGWTSGERRILDAEKNLYQIVEFYDRRVTADGVQCTYKTLLHPDVSDCVAKRELLDEWHGHYPFVAATNEMDEAMLLTNRGVPEICSSAQSAIKTQWDSRSDAASLSTVPPWTGPEGGNALVEMLAPGAFIPSWRSGEVQVLTLPKPDGRSVEIEKTLRASVDRYFGLISKEVPEPLTMLLTQTGVDWFLTSYSRAIGLTAQLIQQRMPRLTGARIVGTDIVFDASPESVRGNFDFNVKFDVRALDIEWTKQILEFVNSTILPMDNRALVDRRVFIEMGVNMIDSALTDRAVRREDDAEKSEVEAMQQILDSIFSGGVPEFIMGVDYQTRAAEMQRDLQSSPVRQRLLATSPEIAAVWENYLQKLLAQIQQEGDNKLAGIQGGGDPLKQSPLSRLKAEGWQGVMAA